MLDSSLQGQLDPRFRDEFGYNTEVDSRLVPAFRCLRRAATRADAYLRAHEHAFLCLNLPMSRRQRMRVMYVLGMAFIGGQTFQTGLACLDEALDLARQLRDWAAWAEITYLHASANSRLFHYAEAADDLKLNVKLLQRFNPSCDPVFVALEVDCLVALAVCDYVLERYADAHDRLDSATAAVGQLPDRAVRLGSISWVRALVYRWTGSPERALPLAQHAAAAYIQASSPAALLAVGRLHTVLADIALDIAGMLPSAPAHVPNAFVRLAGECAGLAVQQTRDLNDPIGAGLAVLAQTRFHHAVVRMPHNLAPLEAVVRIAQRADDVALLAQAYTVLGHALLGRGEEASGLNCYRQALDVVRPSDVPAMGAWARQALVHAATAHLPS